MFQELIRRLQINYRRIMPWQSVPAQLIRVSNLVPSTNFWWHHDFSGP